MKSIITIQKKVTIREGSIKQYINDVSKYNVLTDDEFDQICEIIKTGNEREVAKAQERLIKGNLRFVISVAKQYLTNEMDFPDLISEGNYGLIIAARKYDKEKDVKFSYFSVFWIRKYILEFLAQNKNIKLPQNRVASIKKIKAFINEFESNFGYTPTKTEILANLDIPESDYFYFETEAQYKTSSLSNKVGDSDNDGEVSDMVKSEYYNYAENDHDTEHINHKVETLLNNLKPKEAVVIKLLFGIDHDRSYNMDEVAELVDISKERVRQIRENALNFMRKKLVLSED